MMACKVLLRHGHQAIILAGGATSLIGDPGGKDRERVLLNQTEVAVNIENTLKQFQIIFKNHAPQIRYVNNLDWYRDFKLLDFLRDVGKNFSITPLIQRDYIASRLGKGGGGISYTEFSYTLLQGYDYLKLFEDYQCNLQLGGSDQWGNCLSGIDLIRRKHQVSVHALTLPLIINKATGKKFGKSEEQTIWLDSALTHPADFYQFWLNTNDEDAIDYLKIFTTLPKDTVDAIALDQQQNPGARGAQKKLAEATTRIVHGEQNLQICQSLSCLAFAADTITSPETAKNIQSSINLQPAEWQITIRSSDDDNFQKILDELIDKTPILESRGHIKKLLQANAVKVIVVKGRDATAMNFYSKTPTDLNNLREVLLNKDEQPIIIVVGKNTIRSLNAQ